MVANPPYMGSGNMNSWLSGWTKKRYKEVCKDLCTCFIKRGFSLSDDRGYEALITSDTCMYISSFEKMRKEVIERTSIVCFIDTRGTNAHPDVFDANAGWVLWNHPGANIKGSYFKLNHPIPEKSQRLLEALANPDCGWFYRTNASGFEVIPGSPIAYWVSKAETEAFKCDALGETFITREGMATADNDRFLRCWAEVGINAIGFGCESPLDAIQSKMKWFPYQKGGEFRKWFGNNDFVVNWENDGFEIRNNIDPKTKRIRSHNYNGNYGFRESATWSALSSASIHVRYAPCGSLFDSKGAKGFTETTESLMYSIALINSSSAKQFLKFLAPTLDFKVGDIAKLPNPKQHVATIAAIAEECVATAKSDYDAFEESWGFLKHPLI